MTLERILVTGGAGFIGSHTVRWLLQQNKQVVVLDNLSSGKLENLDLKHPNLEFIEGDVLEYPLVEDLLKNCDAVLHLAAIASVPESLAHPVYSFQVNVQGLLHVLQAMHQVKKSIRLVYASSAAVYGNASTLPCRDDRILSGDVLSPYALQKINDEQYADLYFKLFGIPGLGLRYFNVYGPGQDPNSTYSGVISRFLDAYQKNKILSIFGDGRQSRDFIYISDVVQANWLALNSDYSGVLNVATGKPETLLDLIEYMEKIGKKPLNYQFSPSRAGDILASYATTEMAEQHLGFKHTVSLEKGMEKMVGG